VHNPLRPKLGLKVHIKKCTQSYLNRINSGGELVGSYRGEANEVKQHQLNHISSFVGCLLSIIYGHSGMQLLAREPPEVGCHSLFLITLSTQITLTRVSPCLVPGKYRQVLETCNQPRTFSASAEHFNHSVTQCLHLLSTANLFKLYMWARSSGYSAKWFNFGCETTYQFGSKSHYTRLGRHMMFLQSCQCM